MDKRSRVAFAGLIILCWTVIASPARAQTITPGFVPCGGIADPPCPTGSTCYDLPDDPCSPSCGGADCSGVCAEIPAFTCGGIAGTLCPPGLTCIDAPADDCTPDCGGADCTGICVQLGTETCGGFLGLRCPEGFNCFDAEGDLCHPRCGGADCTGVCGRRGAPPCGGITEIPCPAGLACVDDPDDDCDPQCGGADCSGICVDPLVPCGDSEFPACDGACPDNRHCVRRLHSLSCACEPLPPPCVDTSAPVCGGACPEGSRCAAASIVPGIGCACLPCESVVPGSRTVLQWPGTKDFMVFDPLPCATGYNSYRAVAHTLKDQDGNGLADHYGACLQYNIPIPKAPDPSEPPERLTHFYLVTGLNAVGEGSMGFNGALQERPNTTPCP